MKYHVKMQFTEPLLGTTPLDPDAYREHGAGANAEAQDDELETVVAAEDKGVTGFMREAGQPLLYDYVIKGFFKDACSMLRRVDGSQSAKVKAHKKMIDGLIFIYPRRIPLVLADPQAELEILSRPLRAQTAQGERIALAHSEQAPIGTMLSFEIETLGDIISRALLDEWLDYGSKRGLGQWRNGGYGTFTYTLEPQS